MAAGPRNWYVSPSGLSSNNGTIFSPVDLATALSGAKVTPGSTVWLRTGKYQGHFVSNLKGTATAPITVASYPGEWASIVDSRSNAADSPVLQVYGAWTVYRDFEITNKNTERSTTQLSSTYNRPTGLVTEGPNTKFINLVIHDVGIAVGFWQGSTSAEMYGNIIYENGWSAPDRGHGHGIYTQNDVDVKLIRDNIICDQFGWGIHMYPGPSGINGYQIDGNIIFNNGDLISPSHRYNNILLDTFDPWTASNIKITNNFAYHSSQQVGNGVLNDANICLGCVGSSNYKDIVLSGNYLAGGFPVAVVAGWQIASVSNNTFIGNNGLAVLGISSPDQLKNYVWDYNTYEGNGVYGTNYQFGVNSQSFTFDGWKAYTGFDKNSQLVTGHPKGTKVFVRPNVYTPNRGHIIVYNWDIASSVTVDVSSVLTVGQAFEVRNAENYFGDPVTSGVYSGQPIQIPLTNLSAALPVGMSAPPIVSPEFAAFVIVPR